MNSWRIRLSDIDHATCCDVCYGKKSMKFSSIWFALSQVSSRLKHDRGDDTDYLKNKFYRKDSEYSKCSELRTIILWTLLELHIFSFDFSITMRGYCSMTSYYFPLNSRGFFILFFILIMRNTRPSTWTKISVPSNHSHKKVSIDGIWAILNGPERQMTLKRIEILQEQLISIFEKNFGRLRKAGYCIIDQKSLITEIVQKRLQELGFIFENEKGKTEVKNIDI